MRSHPEILPFQSALHGRWATPAPRRHPSFPQTPRPGAARSPPAPLPPETQPSTKPLPTHSVASFSLPCCLTGAFLLWCFHDDPIRLFFPVEVEYPLL